jgi:hypothetical protein
LSNNNEEGKVVFFEKVESSTNEQIIEGSFIQYHAFGELIITNVPMTCIHIYAYHKNIKNEEKNQNKGYIAYIRSSSSSPINKLYVRVFMTGY